MAESREKPVKEGHLPVSELIAERAGPLSPFGEVVEFPLPADQVAYVHPSEADRPSQTRDPVEWVK